MKMHITLSRSVFPILVIALVGAALPVHAASQSTQVVQTPQAASVTLTIDPQTIAATGRSFSVPIKVAATTGVRGIQFDLKFTPGVVAFPGNTSVAMKSTFWLSAANGGTEGVTCSTAAGVEVDVDSQFTNRGTLSNTAGSLSNTASAPLGVPTGGSCLIPAGAIVATLTFTAVANGLSNNSFANVLVVAPDDTVVPAGTTAGTYSASAGAFQVGSVVAPTATSVPPTATSVPATATTMPPTATTVPPTATTVPPTATGVAPTATSIPATATATTMPPTATGVAPTATSIPATATPLPPPATATSQPPTATPFAATVTPVPATATAVPPTTTPTAYPTEPTSTPVPTGNALTNVDAKVVRNDFLSITVDRDISFGTLALGQNQASGSLNVRSNLDWQVTVADYSPTLEPRLPKPWHLSQWNRSTRLFVIPGIYLNDPLKVSSTQNTVSAGTPNVLLSGRPSGQMAKGETFVITYSQNLTTQDKALPAGQSYHTVLSFIAFATL